MATIVEERLSRVKLERGDWLGGYSTSTGNTDLGLEREQWPWSEAMNSGYILKVSQRDLLTDGIRNLGDRHER